MQNKYDAVIIGAGIGGLVCGCYLAKNGKKVLIVEQHTVPGGYCTSFKRKSFTFDVAVHYLGACRNGGETHRIITELGLGEKIKINRLDPTDKIITPHCSIIVRKNYKNTVENFQNSFFQERKAIKNFFEFIQNRNFLYLYAKLKNITFEQLLSSYFKDYKLKAALSVLLGNVGLSPSVISALTAVTMYREFILDGGYYPEGGMQKFADALAEKFKELGGVIKLSTRANKILIKGQNVKGVVCDGGLIAESDYVVSNADALSTFEDLLNGESNNMLKKAKSLTASTSAFAVYLGISIDLHKKLKDKCTTWYFSSYDIDSCYSLESNNVDKNPLDYIICTFPSLHSKTMAPRGKSTMGIFVGAPYRTKQFWDKHKNSLADRMIKKAEDIIPDLRNRIDDKIIATPQTFEKFTSNSYGAMYGWASRVDQIKRDVFPQKTPINGLILASHWCTCGLGQGGVSVVAFAGRNAAKIILKGDLASV